MKYFVNFVRKFFKFGGVAKLAIAHACRCSYSSNVLKFVSFFAP